MRHVVKALMIFFILILSGCSHSDNSYQNISKKSTELQKKTETKLEIRNLKKYIDGRYSSLKGKNLLWEHSYLVNYKNGWLIYIIPIEIQSSNIYEFIAVSDFKGISDMSLIKMRSDTFKFTSEFYNIHPYEIVKDYNFDGKIVYEQFKNDVFSMGNTIPAPSCGKCHAQYGSDPVLPGFPDELMDELIITVPARENFSEIWTELRKPITGEVIFHLGDYFKNPCETRNRHLMNNYHSINQSIRDLEKKLIEANTFREEGFMMDSQGNYTNIWGQEGEASVNVNLISGTMYDAIIHSHYAGLFKGPSASDLWILYLMAKGGYINNYSTFEFGIVTNEGYVSIHIDDKNKFISAFDNMFPSLLESYYVQHEIVREHASNNIVDLNHKLQKLLDSINSGLSLNYYKKSLNSNGQQSERYYYDSKKKKWNKCN